MATVEHIDHPGDPRLADYVGLTDADRRRRGDVFLCEGVLVIRRAIETGTALQSVLVTPAKLVELEPDLAALDVSVFVASQPVMNEVTGFAIHRGAIAAATPPAPLTLDALLMTPTIAVLEGANDHENLGSLFRNAAAFGVGAMLLDPATVDPLYRRSVRVSLGHVMTVPHRRLDAWPADLEDVRRANYHVVALTPSADAEPIDAVPVTGNVAFIVGAEGPGLSSAALDAADRRVRIPLSPTVDSLNVATAAAIAFHHRFRAG
jgi:tRNA G18 (ribose-2'-O)-methylase SpoU